MRFIMGARSAWDEDHILTRLPPAIRERVLDHVHRDAIEVIPVLRSRTGGYVSAILRQLRPQMYLLVRASETLTGFPSVGRPEGRIGAVHGGVLRGGCGGCACRKYQDSTGYA